MKTLLRIVIPVLLVLLLIAIPGYYLLKGILQKSLPEYGININSPYVMNNTAVYFDSLGIPYISARSEEDAAFALGYLHARDRLFQMELVRRAGMGRLSEVFGEETIEFDKLFRSVGIERTAKKILNNASEETKNSLINYANGVNQYLADHKHNLPLEFDFLGYIPDDWEPLHSIITIRMMAWELNIAFWQDIVLTRAAERAGADKAAGLIPGTVTTSLAGVQLNGNENLYTGFLQQLQRYKEFMGSSGTQHGSNNWVISGSRSAGGAAMLANDPHLTLQMPGRWYLAIIRGGGWNVSGVTLPGVPAVVIGNNSYISWGLTNVMADDADFYALKVTKDRKAYVVDNDTIPFNTIYENIPIKGLEPYEYKILESIFGPVISAVHPHNMDKVRGIYGTEIAMRWTGAEVSDEFFAFFKINRAKDFSEFSSAVSAFKVPGQNFVYADYKGNIGYLCGAGIPVRGSGDPRLVLDGTTKATAWKGFIPFQDLPKQYNPQQGFIATANNKPAESNFYISSLWESSSRIERITGLLKFKEKHRTEDVFNYQQDRISPYASRMTPLILGAFKDLTITDANLKEALTLFKKWEFDFDELSQTPGIYSVFLYTFFRNTLLDELGEELLNDYARISNLPLRVMDNLVLNNNAPLFDDISTTTVETRDDIIRKSLDDALHYLESTYGTNIAGWQWGNLHKVRLKHFFSGRNGLLDSFIDDGPYSIGGDGTTLNLSEYPFYTHNEFGPVDKFYTTVGPSMRYVFDFATPGMFYYTSTGGQSGNIMSGDYKNLTRGWLKGEYIQVKTDEQSFRKNEKQIRFLPG